MKKLFFFLLVLCASASAQTIRTLGYNATNGQVVAATNVTWTNSFRFSTNTVAAQVRTNLGIGLSVLTNTNSRSFLRALANTTNTNHPFTGSFTAVDDVGDAATIVVSNGIIVEFQPQ